MQRVVEEWVSSMNDVRRCLERHIEYFADRRMRLSSHSITPFYRGHIGINSFAVLMVFDDV